MAYPRARSLNAELEEGSTDASYKKVIQDRGGEVELGFWDEREHLSTKGYGIVESPRKDIPGQLKEAVTPMTIATRDPEALGY